ETPSRPHYSVMFIRPQILQSTVPYLYSGMRSIRGWLQQQRARVVHFPYEQDFISYNTENDLAQPL
ncbi:molybdenum cofactor guanylyltransferase, partial [Neisseria sp. P0001.S010]